MLTYNNWVELIAAGVVLVFGLFCVKLDTMIHPWKFTLRQVSILMTALFFGLGPWVSVFAGNGTLPYETRDILHQSYGTVLLFIAGIALTGPLIAAYRGRKEEYSIWKSISFAEHISGKTIAVLFIAVWALRFYLAVEYGILFSGTATEERIKAVPYTFIVLQSILETLAYGCYIWAALNLFWTNSKPRRWGSLIVVLAGLVWSVTQGRRAMMVAAALLFFCYCSNYTRMQLRHFVYGLLLFALLFGIAFPNFLRLRMSHHRQGAQENALTELYGTLSGSSQFSDEEVRGFTRENLSERPLIIRFVCRIFRSQYHNDPMYGSALMRSVIWAIPTAIYGDKRNTAQTEQYIQEHYFQAQFDTSITWAAVGAADFGMFGGLFAGLVLGLVIYFTEWWADAIKGRYPLLAVSMIGSMIAPLCSIEDDPVTIFCAIRAMLLLFGAAVALNWIGFSKYIPQQTVELAESAEG